MNSEKNVNNEQEVNKIQNALTSVDKRAVELGVPMLRDITADYKHSPEYSFYSSTMENFGEKQSLGNFYQETWGAEPRTGDPSGSRYVEVHDDGKIVVELKKGNKTTIYVLCGRNEIPQWKIVREDLIENYGKFKPLINTNESDEALEALFVSIRSCMSKYHRGGGSITETTTYRDGGDPTSEIVWYRGGYTYGHDKQWEVSGKYSGGNYTETKKEIREISVNRVSLEK